MALPALALLCVSAIPLYAFWRVYRAHRVDVFRQSLYKIRDQVYDDAHFHKVINRNDEAYRLLRKRINLLIRFAHRFYFTDYIVIKLRRNGDESGRSIAESYAQEFSNAVKASKTPDYYESVLEHVHIRTIVHVILVSPVFAMSVFGFKATYFLIKILFLSAYEFFLRDEQKSNVDDRVPPSMITPQFVRYESEAMLSQEQQDLAAAAY